MPDCRLALLAVLAFTGAAFAGPPVSQSSASPPVPLEGPFAKRAREILANPYLRTTARNENYFGDANLLNWLVDHPRWAAALWRELGLKVGEVTELPDGYICREDANSAVEFHWLHRSPQLRVLYCVMEAKRPPLPGRMRAEAVLVSRMTEQTVNGRNVPRQDLEAYVATNGATMKAVMKLARGTCERAVEGCLRDTTMYFSLLARLLELRPRWTNATSEKLSRQFPATEAASLQKLVDAAAESARARRPPASAPVARVASTAER